VDPTRATAVDVARALVEQPQPLAAWSRATAARWWMEFRGSPAALAAELTRIAQDGRRPAAERVRALNALHHQGRTPAAELLVALMRDKDPSVRAHAVYLLGVTGSRRDGPALIAVLRDEELLVRRRACEALIRTGSDVPADAIWPLLAEDDRFLRTAARLVLQRIDPKTWVGRLVSEKNDRVVLEAIVALCKTGQAAPNAAAIFERLGKTSVNGPEAALLDYLRTVQLALIHAGNRDADCRRIARRCLDLFPQRDARVNRELAVLLTHFRKEGVIDAPVHAILLAALKESVDDRPQQVHYMLCLRLLKEGWTPEQKAALLACFDSSGDWKDHERFRNSLTSIVAELDPLIGADERLRVLRSLSPTSPAERLRRPAGDRPATSRYAFAELLAFLEKDPRGRKGDPERGRRVFLKAQCASCHKHGRDGDSIGPDLSTLGRRFQRSDILAALLTPSKVVSDQYRASIIETTDGAVISGFVAPQGESVTVLQSNGIKVTLKKVQIKQQLASSVSVMPERLLDPLSKAEIADLFAFLESTPEP
jgi:putative heme-binding domain-containing protein